MVVVVVGGAPTEENKNSALCQRPAILKIRRQEDEDKFKATVLHIKSYKQTNKAINRSPSQTARTT